MKVKNLQENQQYQNIHTFFSSLILTLMFWTELWNSETSVKKSQNSRIFPFSLQIPEFRDKRHKSERKKTLTGFENSVFFSPSSELNLGILRLLGKKSQNSRMFPFFPSKFQNSEMKVINRKENKQKQNSRILTFFSQSCQNSKKKYFFLSLYRFFFECFSVSL